jgi:capsular polysaccharide biosynthesis protein
MLSLKEMLRILRRWVWVIALVVVIAMGVAVGASTTQTTLYEASITVLVGQEGGITRNPTDSLGLQQLTLTMAEAATSLPIAEAVVRQLGLQMTPEALLRRLSAEQVAGTQFVEVSYQDTDPKRAQLVVNAVGTTLSRKIAEVSPDANAVTVTVWERAEAPGKPVGLNIERIGLLALVLGLMLGVGLAFLLEYLDDSWRSPEEVEQVSGGPTLGVIPEFEVQKVTRSSRENVPI